MAQREMTIFSIDDVSPHGLNQFASMMAARGMADRYKQLIGCYKGEVEPSFITPSDLMHTVYDTCCIDGQESVLTVSGCNKMYAVIHYLDGRPAEGLGSMVAVPENIAKTYPAWTYRIDTGAYYVALKMNPDHWREVGPYAGEEMQPLSDSVEAA